MSKSGVFGDRELVMALRELGKGLAPSEIDHAAIRSLDPMLADAKARLKVNRNFAGKYPGFPQPKSPRKGGHVDQGIVVRKHDASKTRRAYRLGATKRSRYLLHLLEYGTAPHWQPNFRGGWMHPGAQAKPTITPAFEAHKDNVPAAVARHVIESLTAKARRLGKSSSKRR